MAKKGGLDKIKTDTILMSMKSNTRLFYWIWFVIAYVLMIVTI